MRDVKRALQINLYVAVLISSTLLGIAMESPPMIAVGVVGATIGFLITDIFRLFYLRGLIANIASFIILFLAMKDFFSLDGTGKLVSVANLLVYLQTVLMFQEKVPRLNWQVMVLTLLQVVVSAIFSLDLEGGLLLLTYFLVIGSAMFYQSIYSQQFEIENNNKFSSGRAMRAFGWLGGALSSNASKSESANSNLANSVETSVETADPSQGSEDASNVDRNQPGSNAMGRSDEAPGEVAPVLAGGPVTFFDYRAQAPLRMTVISLQLLMWAATAFAFTMVLFYLAPRHAPPWYGPVSTIVTTAGVSKSVDLDERGIIELSSQLMFRVQFRKQDGSDLRLSGTPYFRGLALSDLVIKNGKTDWRAPQDRVSDEHYQPLPQSYIPQDGNGALVYQSFKMEETEDPLVYGVFPFFRAEATPKRMQFCHEISGLTRCRLRESIDLAPYKYQATTLIDPAGRFAKSWPYISNTGPYVQRPMSEDPPQMAWLTKIDPQRYETVCALSDQISRENQAAGGKRIDLFRRMENYFQAGGRFRYTLDFRKIKRDESLDPIEDFVRNHRSGHCELYASALTIMLRRQGIPARLVVGFRGGSYNQLTNSYLVRANNAHAWVEAYLPKEACTDEMLRTGQAGEGGAWMILESTPLGSDALGDSDDSLDIARSVWDDYVLGRDNDSSGDGSYGAGMFGWLRYLDMDYVDQQLKNAQAAANQPWIKFGIPGAMLLVFFFLLVRSSLKPDKENQKQKKKAGLIRRVFARAISLISPQLSKWVMGDDDSMRVDFYERLASLLARHQLVRQPNQTHREFARDVATQFAGHEQASLIQNQINQLTEYFNQVRFGRTVLDPNQSQEVALSLQLLEQTLSKPSSSKPTSTGSSSPH